MPTLNPIIMATFNETDVLLNLQQLIDRNVCSKDGFFTDSRKAADEILRYLQSEKIIGRNEVAVEIKLSEQSRAA